MATDQILSRAIYSENSWLMSSLSAVGGVLTDLGELSPKYMTDFRVNLSGMQGSKSRSMIDGLFEAQDALFHYISKSIGQDHLASTAWLQFSKRLSARIIETLSKTQIEYIEFGKQNFNRFILTSQGEYFLVPELIMDMNGQISGDLEHLKSNLDVLFLSHHYSNQATPEELAACFNLESIVHTSLPKNNSADLMTKRFFSISRILEARSQLLFFVTGSPADLRWQILSGLLKSLQDVLCEVPKPLFFESSMERALSLSQMIESLIREVHEFSMLSLSKTIISLDDPACKVASHRIEGFLIRQGYSPEVASQATSALKDYLKLHKISVKALLLTEGIRLHPALAPETIAYVQSAEVDLMKSLTLKDRVDQAFELIAGKLNRILELSPVVVILLFFVASCGVKGSLKSIAEPIRPTVPLIGDPNAPSK
jgi:hypothetical protein